ncbi:MAG: energy transducer TonB, partial [Krumholzibacteria bacterium]|nr:energy transducer TonB [Candidatus Krumholzibacteria bacterium]
SATELGTVDGSVELARADLGGSTLVADGLSIGEVGAALAAPPPVTGGAGGIRGAGAQAGEVRSNESLLAVVRRYAPAIQFCYENELKKNPGLRGKLVVSLTVTADGAVTEATIIEDGLGAPAVTGCSLAQIRGWQFPPVPAGVTTFQVPFLFTPPQ